METKIYRLINNVNNGTEKSYTIKYNKDNKLNNIELLKEKIEIMKKKIQDDTLILNNYKSMLLVRKACINRNPSNETNKSLIDQVYKLRKSILINIFNFLPVGRLSPSMCFLFHLCIPDELSPLPIPSILNLNIKTSNKDISNMNQSTWIEPKKKGWIPTIYNLLPRKSTVKKQISDLPASFSASLPFILINETTDPEILYALLGYLCYLIPLIASYFNVILPNSTKFLGSRSIIFDTDGKEYKLYYPTLKNDPPANLMHAISLLYINVKVLCENGLINSGIANQGVWKNIFGKNSLVSRLAAFFDAVGVPNPTFQWIGFHNDDEEWNIVQNPDIPLDDDDLKTWEEYEIPRPSSN